eukprot:1615076-Rhodomonas_salina.2
MDVLRAAQRRHATRSADASAVRYPVLTYRMASPRDRESARSVSHDLDDGRCQDPGYCVASS